MFVTQICLDTRKKPGGTDGFSWRKKRKLQRNKNTGWERNLRCCIYARCNEATDWTTLRVERKSYCRSKLPELSLRTREQQMGGRAWAVLSGQVVVGEACEPEQPGSIRNGVQTRITYELAPGLWSIIGFFEFIGNQMSLVEAVGCMGIWIRKSWLFFMTQNLLQKVSRNAELLYYFITLFIYLLANHPSVYLVRI